MNQIISLWNRFISVFPPPVDTLISIGIFIGIVVMFLDLVKKNLLWILLLILFVPASIPILKTIYQGVVVFLAYILP